jgi:hypothetical protein
VLDGNPPTFYNLSTMPLRRLKSATLSQEISESKRDDLWLLSRLNFLWDNYFSDVTQDNPVYINFGRYSKFRLGSIRLEKHSKRTYITITGMFKNPKIPLEIVDHTIAHEMCHYVHGFSSLKPRLHKYPHHGGIVNKELRQRGMDFLIKGYSKWLKSYKKELSS